MMLLTPNTSALIHAKLTELFVELASLRDSLERCPPQERLSVANRIRVVQDEIQRGKDLLSRFSPAPAGPKAPTAPPGSDAAPSMPAFLSTWKETNR